MKLEDPEGQAILSPVSTPKCSMHTGPTVFFFLLVFLSLASRSFSESLQTKVQRFAI